MGTMFTCRNLGRSQVVHILIAIVHKKEEKTRITFFGTMVYNNNIFGYD